MKINIYPDNDEYYFSSTLFNLNLQKYLIFCYSDMIWDTAERLVNRSTLIENSEDAKKIMRAPSKHKSLHRLKSMDGQVKNIENLPA